MLSFSIQNELITPSVNKKAQKRNSFVPFKYCEVKLSLFVLSEPKPEVVYFK